MGRDREVCVRVSPSATELFSPPPVTACRLRLEPGMHSVLFDSAACLLGNDPQSPVPS